MSAQWREDQNRRADIPDRQLRATIGLMLRLSWFESESPSRLIAVRFSRFPRYTRSTILKVILKNAVPFRSQFFCRAL
jgi:hypothetical protein